MRLGMIVRLLLIVFTFSGTPLFAANNVADDLSNDAANLIKDTAKLVQDTAIVAAIHAKIALDKNLSNYDIDISCNRGAVELTGTVNSDAEATNLIQLATSTNGVKTVDASKLVVKKASHPITDTEITAKVKGVYLREKLFGDKPVSVWDVEVETEDGVVYLSGTVDTLEEQENAVKLAESVSGVVRVESEITVVKR